MIYIVLDFIMGFYKYSVSFGFVKATQKLKQHTQTACHPLLILKRLFSGWRSLAANNTDIAYCAYIIISFVLLTLRVLASVR